MIVSGQVNPKGFPIIVQSRFEAKVKAVAVSEGANIRKNDILILLEKNIDESELYELEYSILSSAMKISRLERQLEEENSFNFESTIFRGYASINDDLIASLFSEQNEILRSEIIYLENEIKLILSQRQVKASEITVIDANISALKADLILANKKFLLTQNLFNKNFVGELDLLEASSEKTQVKKALTENLTQRDLKESELLLLEEELENKKIEFKRNVLLDLVAEKENFRNANIRRDGVLNKLEEYSITAPVSGIVSHVGAENAGQILSVGTTVAEIIPESTPFVFYGELPVQHINDVSIGQEVLLTLSNFDPRTDEMIQGKVVEIAEDTTARENSEAYYQLIIEFEELTKVQSFLKSGLTGSGSILLGETNVFGYYFEPIWKSLRFALTEA